MEKQAVRAAGADLMTHLLQDIAPELALRWVARAASLKGNEAPSPALCRGLVSTLLRASSHMDAVAVLEVLDATAVLPQEAPLARLGFTAKTPPGRLHEILEDLLSAAILKLPLSQNGPALTFYSNAGVGSNDDAEYEGVEDGHADPHVRFTLHQPKLSDVREKNVILCLGYFSTVFRLISTSPAQSRVALVANTMSDETRSRLWKLLFQALPSNIQTLLPDSITAVQALFGSLIACESTLRQDEIASELVTVFNSLALKKGSPALGLYARSLSLCKVRMKACILCLTRIFNANDDPSAPCDRMSISRFAYNFVHPLLSTKMSPSHLTGVPALLTTLGETWLELGEQKDFVVPRSQVPTIVEVLNSAVRRLEKQRAGCVTRDVLSTQVVLLTLCNSVELASNGAT